MDILPIYHDYLVHLEKERENTGEKMFQEQCNPDYWSQTANT